MMSKTFLFLPLLFCFHAKAQADEVPTLSVTGRGEVFAEPDQAVIEVGVQAEEPTAGQAQASVNTSVQRVLTALAGLKIDPKQIQTSQLTLHAVYADARNRMETSGPRIIAYRASYTLSVRTQDLTRISAIIDTALDSGANQLGGVRFELKDEQTARQEALRRAVADAVDKAKVVSEAAAVQLLRILTIVEGGASVRPALMARSAAMAAEASGAPTPVMPGQVTITGQVNIRYEVSEE